MLEYCLKAMPLFLRFGDGLLSIPTRSIPKADAYNEILLLYKTSRGNKAGFLVPVVQQATRYFPTARTSERAKMTKVTVEKFYLETLLQSRGGQRAARENILCGLRALTEIYKLLS